MRWTTFYQNPRLLLLVSLLLLGAGLASYSLLPRSEDPEQVNRYSFILTEWPGAGAERVETLVTEPIEQELLALENVRRFRSTSAAGMSVIQLELKQSVTNVHSAWSKVRDRMNELSARLPEGVTTPYVAETEESSAYTMIVGVTWNEDSEVPRAILLRLARELEERLRFVAGTEYTRLFGANREEILVEARGDVLAEIGMSAGDLAAVISANDPKVTAGRVQGEHAQLHLELSGEHRTLEDLRQVAIVRGDDGRTLLLGDIATVRRGVTDPPDELAFLDGKPGIAVAARMEPGQRVDRWAARANAAVESFSADVSGGVGLEVLFDQSEYVGASMDRLQRSLGLGMLCVIAVTLLLMGWRAAVVVSAALPICVMLVLSGMYALGVTIHQISIIGIILSLGLLIDNAVIMVDEMRRRFAEGLNRESSILSSCKHLLAPLFGSTLTTILAFTPLLLLSGAEGDFVGPLGVTVVLSLAASFGVALLITPALSAHMMGESRIKSRFAWLRNGIGHTRITSQYRKTIDAALHHPTFAIALALIFPVLGFAMAGSLRPQFFPPSDRNQFRVQMKMPPQASIVETAKRARDMEHVIRAHGEVQRVDLFVGSHLPRFFYNAMSWERNQANIAHAIVEAKDRGAVRTLVHMLQEELDTALPDAQVLVLELEQGSPIKAPIEVRIEGPDLDTLQRLGNDVRGVLAATPGVIHTGLSLSTGRPKLALNLDEIETHLAGLDEVAIANALEGRLEGAIGGAIVETTEELPIRVRVTDAERSDPERLASFEMPNGAKQGSVPLDALGVISIEPEFSVISHNDNVRDNEVYAYLRAGLLPAEVLRDVKTRIADSGLEIPAGYTLEYGGEEETRGDAIDMLLAGIPLLLLAMFGTLVLAFGSFRLAALIGTVGFLSVGCAMTALWLFDFPLGFMAIVGTMGLVGIAINDSIVVLAAIREHPGARKGDPVAIRKVVVRSTRHVLTTSLTTMAGFTPLFLAGGLFWPPLAVAIGGGVFGATLLALFFVPGSYVILTRGRRRIGARTAPTQADVHHGLGGVLSPPAAIAK